MECAIKHCKVCQKSINASEWASLPLVGHQVDEYEDIELRDCSCGSTLGVVVAIYQLDEAA